jgi:hypothetical protein
MACRVFEEYSPKFLDVRFVPTSAVFSNNTWQFRQDSEGGIVYRFVYYLKDNTCSIFRENHESGQVLLTRFSSSGKALRSDTSAVEDQDPFQND